MCIVFLFLIYYGVWRNSSGYISSSSITENEEQRHRCLLYEQRIQRKLIVVLHIFFYCFHTICVEGLTSDELIRNIHKACCVHIFGLLAAVFCIFHGVKTHEIEKQTIWSDIFPCHCRPLICMIIFLIKWIICSKIFI